MLGLIDKDVRLLMKRKQVLVIFLVLAIMMSFTQDSAFAISYTTFLCAFLAISSLNYDEMDNGFQFIMTLPVSRKVYVASKYLFAFGAGLIGWLISVIVSGIYEMVGNSGAEEVVSLGQAALFIPAFVVIISVMLPLQFIFGMERSRIAMAFLAAGVVILGATFAKVGIGEPTNGIMLALDNTPIYMLNLGFVVISAVICAISYAISVKTMENKEY